MKLNPVHPDNYQRVDQGKIPAERCPAIVVAEDVLAVIHEYVSRFIETQGLDTETGGMLAGEYEEVDGTPTFKIRGFIGAGPNAEYSWESVLFDSDYQARVLQSIRQGHPRIGNMGCIHMHPDGMDICSEGDWVADVEAVRSSDTKALVFAIITVNNGCD